jgi:transcriptional regulator with XRE-family HTH domain
MNKTLDLNKLRSEIDSKGLKVKYLAEKIGVMPCTLSSFLTGKRGLGNAAFISLLRELNLTTKSVSKKAS